jgi:quercetin dioxygenase-like cupin family protein
MNGAIHLHDLVRELPIPEDGTLSKTLHRSDSVRLVGFAFAEGQELTEHSSALEVTIQVLTGRLALTLGDAAETTLDASGWVHMPPRMPHSVRALEPTIMLLTMYPAAFTQEPGARP